MSRLGELLESLQSALRVFEGDNLAELITRAKSAVRHRKPHQKRKPGGKTDHGLMRPGAYKKAHQERQRAKQRSAGSTATSNPIRSSEFVTTRQGT